MHEESSSDGAVTRRRIESSLQMLRNDGLTASGLTAEAVEVLESVLLAANTLLGECLVTVPPAPLRPVIDAAGNFHWCCSHTPQHCAT